MSDDYHPHRAIPLILFAAFVGWLLMGAALASIV